MASWWYHKYRGDLVAAIDLDQVAMALFKYEPNKKTMHPAIGLIFQGGSEISKSTVYQLTLGVNSDSLQGLYEHFGLHWDDFAIRPATPEELTEG